jgi:hypothetical protein
LTGILTSPAIVGGFPLIEGAAHGVLPQGLLTRVPIGLLDIPETSLGEFAVPFPLQLAKLGCIESTHTYLLRADKKKGPLPARVAAL